MVETVLDRIRKQVEELSDEEVKEQLAKLQAKSEAAKSKGVGQRSAGDPE